jgi:hypothetical protein
VGSNPTLSASTTFADIQQRPKTPDLHTEGRGFLFVGIHNGPAPSGPRGGSGGGFDSGALSRNPQNSQNPAFDEISSTIGGFMPKLGVPLTEAQLRRANPREKLYKLFDGGGLYLQVMPTGQKVWKMKYRQLGGKENSLSFGLVRGTSEIPLEQCS